MLNKKLSGLKIAIVATDGFEQSELLEPKKALEKEGAETFVISINTGAIKAWEKSDWGKSVIVDFTFDETSPETYDALVLPGGVINADKIRANAKAIEFVNHFANVGKPIAVICHGAWVLTETAAIQGRTLTSWPSLKTDLINSGAHWVDREVMVDQGWVSSRKPADLPAFNEKMIEEFGEGRHVASKSKRSTWEQEVRH